MLKCPTAYPETSPAASEQCWLLRVALLDHVLIQSFEVRERMRTAVTFSDVDPCDCDSGIKELLMHPAFRFIRDTGERRPVKYPRLLRSRCFNVWR